MKREAKQLVADLTKVSDPEKRQEMQRTSIYLAGPEGAIQSPIMTNRFLAQLYLGTEIVPLIKDTGEIAGIRDIKFGQTKVRS